MNERMADDGEAGLGGLAYQLPAVRLPGCVDPGEAAEMPEGLSVGVGLVVELGVVALVGAEHGGEGAELGPAYEQFFRTTVLEQRVVYGGVAADVRVLEAVVREAAREQARHGARHAVVLVPAHYLVSIVHMN
jgi:hypothetical protein